MPEIMLLNSEGFDCFDMFSGRRTLLTLLLTKKRPVSTSLAQEAKVGKSHAASVS